MTISFESFADMLADLHVPMVKEVFLKMLRDCGEYSSSYPSGVVPGKLWLRHDGVFDPRCKPEDRMWMVCWYSDPPFIDSKGEERCYVNMLPLRFTDGFDPNDRSARR